jgi:hypothetical protein
MKSACNPIQIAQPTPDPVALLDDLLVHHFLASDGPAEGEIEEVQGTTIGGAATATTTTAGAPLPEVRDSVLFADLAEELQRREGFKKPAACLGLEVTPTAIEDDPLTSDLIQRLYNQEIRKDPPATWDIMADLSTSSKSKLK